MDPSAVVPGEAPHGSAQWKVVELKMTRPFQTAGSPRNLVQKPSQDDPRGRPLPYTEGAVNIARPARRKGRALKQSYVRPEKKKEKEKLECYEDDDDENLPFTNYLKAMEIPANFRMPLMEKYNGRRDPSDHINTYKTKLQGQSPIVKCRNFHTTFAFDTKRCSTTSWQKEGETVKSYFKRFNNVIDKIETVTDEKALDALVTGLHMCTLFWRDVQNSQPKTYSQLVDLVQHEIRSEETIKNREKAERKRGDRYRREGRRSP
ncbi:Uncharacterized protein Adt_29602 [Abeliophyllum distichum]|uniref:Retrotransposon gag domain-containing protein n=1 Tax=Abeliophyllum distichum TaxID=126358 RepID=A0ABD1R9R5_9LAMI